MMDLIRRWFRKRKYRPGRELTRFIACDIRRDVLIVDASEIGNGVITARVRTWNVLYQVKGLQELPPYGEARRIGIRELWDWEGEPWGGPVPDPSKRR